MNIKAAVAEVPGICGQTIQVDGYVQAEELTELINQLTLASAEESD
jgi:hypothetical protein